MSNSQKQNDGNELQIIEKKLDLIHAKVRKIYVIFMFMIIANILLFVLPLILLAFAIPWALDTGESYKGLL